MKEGTAPLSKFEESLTPRRGWGEKKKKGAVSKRKKIGTRPNNKNL